MEIILLLLFLILLSAIAKLVEATWPIILAAIVFAILYGVCLYIHRLIQNAKINKYFKSEEFLSIKSRIHSYVSDCNALNRHIENLKSTSLAVNREDVGEADYQDNSLWQVNRPRLKEMEYRPTVYNCSRTVCANARNKPFVYICKYFGITADEETLEQFENLLNNFDAAEDGKMRLTKEREDILSSIENDVPLFVRKRCPDRLKQELGFDPVNLSSPNFPKYEFRYTSPAGNTGMTYAVCMDIENLNHFIPFLSEKIQFRKSAAGQRALMTSSLREKIKKRDGYMCKQCGASLDKEPNLLLEIDHIIPISKGGLTTEDNLQTLCWRCNRHKGAKI